MNIPICCVTGRIAGDSDACGDCDPCLAAHTVAEPVRRLLAEKDEWRQKYAEAMGQLDSVRSPPSETPHVGNTKINRYDHGGARIFIERDDGSRDLVADLYDDEQAERREQIIATLIGAGVIAPPDQH